MEKKIGILWVQDDEKGYLESLISGVTEELGLLLPDYEIKFFPSQDIASAFDLFVREEKRINFIITDVAVPEESQHEDVMARISPDQYQPRAASQIEHNFGGFNLIRQLTERLRTKNANAEMMFNLPVIYISAGETLKYHTEFIRLYHRSMTFDWIDLLGANLRDFASLIVDLFRIYEAKLRREAAANTK